MLLVLAIILLTVTGACTAEECDCGTRNAARILNGVETRHHEFPAVAGYIYEGTFRCGATIISDRYAITAASCLVDATSYDKGALVVGAHKKFGFLKPYSDFEETSKKIIPIELTISHSNFNHTASNGYDDIAILKTEKPIPFDQYVGPACLPFYHLFDTFEGETVTITGWGDYANETDENTSKKSFLRKGEVRIVENKFCPEIDFLKQMCTFSSSIASCAQDAGDPVFWTDSRTFQLIFVGIVNEPVKGRCHPDNRAYTRVNYHLSFITENLKGVEFCRA